MDVSELRKRIIRAIDEAKHDVKSRRQVVDAARAAYDTFLDRTAVPLLRQAVTVLRASGQSFEVHTPAGSARLVAEGSPHTFLELDLDVDGSRPEVIGRVSLARGRRGQIVEERPVAAGRAVDALTEEDLAAFLVEEIPRLVVR